MTIFNTKNKIMFGIYLMYFLRKLKKPRIAESFVFFILIATLSVLVSVPSVVSNMFHSGNFTYYFITAFSNTDFFVQFILVLTFITGVSFVKSIAVDTAPKTFSA